MTERRTHPTQPRPLEAASRPLLVRLTALPRATVPLVTVVLVAVGVLAPPAFGLPALAVVALFVAWIAYLSWPAVGTGGRLMRLAMIALVVVLGVTRL